MSLDRLDLNENEFVNYPEQTPENTLVCNRVIVFRVNKKTGEREELFLFNNERQNYERPGGKAFDTKEQQEVFNTLRSSEGNYFNSLIPEALGELERETGLKADVSKLVRIGAARFPLTSTEEGSDQAQAPYCKNGLECYYMENNFWAYEVEDPDWVPELGGDDDDHDREPLWDRYSGLTEELARNSNYELLDSHYYQHRVFRALNRSEFMRVPEAVQAMILGESKNVKITDLDIKDGVSVLSMSDKIALWEKTFGDLDLPENRELFFNSVQKALAYNYNRMHREKDLDSLKAELLDEAPTKKLVLKYLKAFNNPDLIEACRQTFIVSSVYALCIKEAPWMFDEGFLTHKNKEFTKTIANLTSNSKAPNYYKSTCPDEKNEFRIIDKLLTKPELNFENVKDVLRAQIVVKKSADIGKWVEFIKAQLGSTFSLKKKDRISSGTSFDASYYFEGGTGGDYCVPVEIRIITKDDYESGNTTDEYHDFYKFKKLCEREDRLDGGVDNDFVKSNIDRLAHLLKVQDEKAGDEKTFKKMAKFGAQESQRVIKKAQENLWDSFKDKFYKVGNRWYSKSNKSRLKNVPFSRRPDEPKEI